MPLCNGLRRLWRASSHDVALRYLQVPRRTQVHSEESCPGRRAESAGYRTRRRITSSGIEWVIRCQTWHPNQEYTGPGWRAAIVAGSWHCRCRMCIPDFTSSLPVRTSLLFASGLRLSCCPTGQPLRVEPGWCCKYEALYALRPSRVSCFKSNLRDGESAADPFPSPPPDATSSLFRAYTCCCHYSGWLQVFGRRFTTGRRPVLSVGHEPTCTSALPSLSLLGAWAMWCLLLVFVGRLILLFRVSFLSSYHTLCSVSCCCQAGCWHLSVHFSRHCLTLLYSVPSLAYLASTCFRGL